MSHLCSKNLCWDFKGYWQQFSILTDMLYLHACKWRWIQQIWREKVYYILSFPMPNRKKICLSNMLFFFFLTTFTVKVEPSEIVTSNVSVVVEEEEDSNCYAADSQNSQSQWRKNKRRRRLLSEVSFLNLHWLISSCQLWWTFKLLEMSYWQIKFFMAPSRTQWWALDNIWFGESNICDGYSQKTVRNVDLTLRLFW